MYWNLYNSVINFEKHKDLKILIAKKQNINYALRVLMSKSISLVVVTLWKIL